MFLNTSTSPPPSDGSKLSGEESAQGGELDTGPANLLEWICAQVGALPVFAHHFTLNLSLVPRAFVVSKLVKQYPVQVVHSSLFTLELN